MLRYIESYLGKTANIQYCSIEFLKGLMKATISKYVSKQKIVIDFPFHLEINARNVASDIIIGANAIE